jgi:hypothetical protein
MRALKHFYYHVLKRIPSGPKDPMILFVYVRAEARTLHWLKPLPFIDRVLPQPI